MADPYFAFRPPPKGKHPIRQGDCVLNQGRVNSVSSELGSRSETVLKPSSGWFHLDLVELFRFRQLIYFMAWRDVKVKYKQAAFGIGWAVIQPVVTMLVFTVVFSNLLGVSTDGDEAYPVFVYAALVPWTFFSTALTHGAGSVVENAQLVEKIYFPRVILPISAVLASMLDLAIAFTVLIGMIIYYGVPVTWTIAAIPGFVLLAVATSLGVSLWISAFNVRYRDFRYGITFLTTVWLYATPVAYSASLVPEKWRLVYNLNPMVGVIEGFRWAIFGSAEVPGFSTAISVVIVGVLLVSGLVYFRRVERTFADVI